MDSPEEVSSPLLHANTPDIEPEDERPITPELTLPDQPGSYNGGNLSPGISYEPPSPINLPTFDDEDDFKGTFVSPSGRPKGVDLGRATCQRY